MGRIDFTAEELRRFSPKMVPFYVDALLNGKDDLAEAGILATGQRFSLFMGQFGGETAGGTILRESLHYTSVGAVRNAWRARASKHTNAWIKANLLKKPVALGDWAYGGRMGNRKGTSDGFDFRGGGLIQTTGRKAVEDYCRLIGIEPRADALDDPVATLRFACAEWKESGCNAFADANDVYGLSQTINTGSAKSGVVPNGMEHRESWTAKARTIWWDAVVPIEDEAEQPPEAAPEAPARAPVTAALDRMPFGRLNELVDQGSRLAAHIQRFFRWLWLVIFGTATAAATVNPNKGSAGALAKWISANPLLSMLIVACVAFVIFYVMLWLVRCFLLTASDSGRYQPAKKR